MLEVVAVANKAYTQVLKNFPDFLTGSSVTIALVDTLVKAYFEFWKGLSNHMRTGHNRKCRDLMQKHDC